MLAQAPAPDTATPTPAIEPLFCVILYPSVTTPSLAAARGGIITVGSCGTRTRNAMTSSMLLIGSHASCCAAKKMPKSLSRDWPQGCLFRHVATASVCKSPCSFIYILTNARISNLGLVKIAHFQKLCGNGERAAGRGDLPVSRGGPRSAASCGR
jgi:hypothetical protein